VGNRGAYAEDGLWIWRTAANILSKQQWTADKGQFSSLEFGRGANNSPNLQKDSFLRNVTQSFGIAGPCEHGNEPAGSIKGGLFLD